MLKQNFKTIFCYLLITGVLLPSFGLAQGIEAPKTLDEAKVFGLKILEQLPDTVKEVWQKEALPLWQKMWEWTRLTVRQVKPIIEPWWQKFFDLLRRKAEKEVQKELPKIKESLWQNLLERFKNLRPTPTPTPTPVPIPTPETQTGDIDLDVAYISRTPRYDRYKVCYLSPGSNPYLCPGQNEKKWPSPEEIVTYTAKIINKGGESSIGFEYKWFINDVEVSKNINAGLAPGGSVLVSYQWAWKDGENKIKFVVDSKNQISETSEINNQVDDYTNALAFRIHVESTVYQQFNALTNLVGTKSFEDWIGSQFKAMENYFSQAGINEKIRIDEIVIEPDGSLQRWGEHAPEDLAWDGRWGFETTEFNAARIQNVITMPAFGALIHELTHQLGIIDSYNLNYDWNYVTANMVIPNCSSFPGGDTTGYKDCVYYNPNLRGMMTGAYDDGYSEFTAKALNSNLGYRRGFFGEYLYDIPLQNKIKILDKQMNPIPGAEVSFYQDENCTSLPKTIKFFGATDAQGFFTLPNKEAPQTITATGHKLQNNPFGNINIVGCNGIFLIKIISNSQTDYQWIDISMFNLAYWGGDKQNATYNINTDITP